MSAVKETIGTLLGYMSVGNLDFKTYFGYASYDDLDEILNSGQPTKFIPGPIMDCSAERRYRLILKDGVSFPTNLGAAYSDPSAFYHTNGDHNLFYDDNHRTFIVDNINEIDNDEDSGSYIPYWHKYTLPGDVLINLDNNKIYERLSGTSGSIASLWDEKISLGGDSITGLANAVGTDNFNFTTISGIVIVSFTDIVEIPQTLNIASGFTSESPGSTDLLNVQSGNFVVTNEDITSKYDRVYFRNSDNSTYINFDFREGEDRILSILSLTDEEVVIDRNCNFTTSGDVTCKNNTVTGILSVSNHSYLENDIFVISSDYMTSAPTHANSTFSIDVATSTIYSIGSLNLKDSFSDQVLSSDTDKLTIHKDFYIVSDETDIPSESGTFGNRDSTSAFSVNRDDTNIENFGNTYARGNILFGVATEQTDLVDPKKISGYGNIEVKKNITEETNYLKRRSGHSTIEGFGRTGLVFNNQESETPPTTINFDVTEGNVLHIYYESITDGQTLVIGLEDHSDGTYLERAIGGSFTIIIEVGENVGSEDDELTISFSNSRFIKLQSPNNTATLYGSNDVVVYSGIISGETNSVSPGNSVRFMGSVSKPIGNLLSI